MQRMMASSRTKLALAAAVGLVVLAGCAKREVELAQEPPSPPGAEYAAEEAAPEMAARTAAGGAVDISATGDTAAALSMISTVEAAQARKIIKTADLDIEVENLDEAQTTIVDLVDDVGGFISSLTVNEYDTRTQSEIVARVPSAHFRRVYDAAKELGDVKLDRIGGQDVTEEYANLQIRIDNKQALAERYRQLAARSGKVSELLEVERELARVRGEIEQLQGRLRMLKDQVAFSTLTITLTEYGEAPVEETAAWQIAYHLKGAWRGLVRAVQAVVTALIYIVITGAVVWIPLVIAIWLIVRYRRRQKEEAEGPPPPPSEEQ
ncbi:MAG: DUF4349 domain-containing protein [Armatimonadota bacterium]|nr:DUF4349 domain-containing protein [Armatimonadota bacterium]